MAGEMARLPETGSNSQHPRGTLQLSLSHTDMHAGKTQMHMKWNLKKDVTLKKRPPFPFYLFIHFILFSWKSRDDLAVGGLS